MRFMLAVTPMDRHFIAVNVERLGLKEEWSELLEAFKGAGGELID